MVVTSFWLSDLGQAVVAVPAMSLISEFSAVGGLSRDAQPEKNLEIKNLEIKNLEMLHRPRKWGFKQVEGQSSVWWFLSSQWRKYSKVSDRGVLSEA